MKFIADSMLGRLAKRLRLLGFDVVYDPVLDDRDIIRVSIEQDRIILTRDTRLAARPLASRHLLVSYDRVQDQVSQVLSRFPLPAGQSPLTRCSRCNALLHPLLREQARDLVPAQVYATQRAFFACPGCGRVYWKGSHLKRMGGKNGVQQAGPPDSDGRPR